MEYFESPRNLYDASQQEFSHAAKIVGEKPYEHLVAARRDEELENAERIIGKINIQIMTLLSPDYPPLLKSIYDPPPVLYCMGQPIKQDRPAIAVVGSRRSSEYGRMAARQMAGQLAQAGAAVISGMARGIDTMAHKGALDTENGYTAAVLGCGVDYVYPPENKALYEEILERGSAFPER